VRGTCGLTFNRKFNLRSDMKSKHSDERPYLCGTCEKAFSRDTDRRRHENTHAEQKKFACIGNLQTGTKDKWGSGVSFARLEGLKRHFISAVGRECLRPLWDEELDAEQSEPGNKESQLRLEAVVKGRKQEQEQILREQATKPSTPEELEHTEEPLVDHARQESVLAPLGPGVQKYRLGPPSVDARMLGQPPLFLEPPWPEAPPPRHLFQKAIQSRFPAMSNTGRIKRSFRCSEFMRISHT
jgi:hypothetical protein